MTATTDEPDDRPEYRRIRDRIRAENEKLTDLEVDHNGHIINADEPERRVDLKGNHIYEGNTK